MVTPQFNIVSQTLQHTRCLTSLERRNPLPSEGHEPEIVLVLGNRVQDPEAEFSKQEFLYATSWPDYHTSSFSMRGRQP